MKKIIGLFIVIVLFGTTDVLAQRTTDIDGAKDYPLVSRFKGSIIEYYKVTKWDSYKLPVFENDITKPNYENPLKLEGTIIRTQYSVSPDNNPAFVLKNYEDAFTKSGYRILLKGKPGEDFDEGPAGFGGDYYGSQKGLNLGKFGFTYNPIGNHKAIIVAKTIDAGKAVYIVEVISDFSNVTLITQDVIEVELPKTGSVTAKSLAEGLSAKGHIVLDGIYFKSGKAEVKSTSAEALKNIAEYLNAHPKKKFVIVGHTDNTGDFDANVTLSQERANAVMNELITNYKVNADQLKAFGAGAVAPVATNVTKEGRALNRRVEIVEL